MIEDYKPLVTITHLSVVERCTKYEDGKYEDIPYLIVNATWKVKEEREYRIKDQFLAKTKDYIKCSGIPWSDIPGNISQNDLTNYLDNVWSSGKIIGKSKHFLNYQDPIWQYLPKFDTFWMRTWIADSPTTRAILSELEYFKTHGKLPTVYRTAIESIVMRHLENLDSYWD